MLELLAPWLVVGIVCVMAYNCYKQVKAKIKAQNERNKSHHAYNKRPRQ
jgi:hypothetical protein